MTAKPNEVFLMDVRIAFCQSLFKPQSFVGNDGSQSPPKHSATFIFPPDHPAAAAMKAAIRAVAAEKWPKDFEMRLRELHAKNAICLRDGAQKASYEGFDGNLFVAASNKLRPTIINRDRSPINESDGIIYAGCRVNAKLDVWAQEHPKWGRRINATLLGVQFLADDEAFSGVGKVASPDEFEEFPVENEADLDLPF